MNNLPTTFILIRMGHTPSGSYPKGACVLSFLENTWKKREGDNMLSPLLIPFTRPFDFQMGIYPIEFEFNSNLKKGGLMQPTIGA